VKGNDIGQLGGGVKKVVWIVVFSLVTIHWLLALSIARETLPETQKVFGKYSDRVVKIQVVEKESGAKAVIGSGFFVDPGGHIVTSHNLRQSRRLGKTVNRSKRIKNHEPPKGSLC